VTNAAARFVGISLDTSRLDAARRDALRRDWEAEFGLPVIDPVRDGAMRIVDVLLREFPCASN
jgi:uncharacterized NAD-dependent epimerase/dehydratase family protein